MIKTIGIALATAFAACAGGYLVSLNAGCAALKADEPIIAADVEKGIDYACAADALAATLVPDASALAVVRSACPAIQLADKEISTFASKLAAHPAIKDAGAGG
jgi:hypothetical protein